MSTNTTIELTPTEYRNLLNRKESLQRKLDYCHENNYSGNAYHDCMSPSEYKEASSELNAIEKKLKNAVITPIVALNKKITISANNKENLKIIITVNPTENIIDGYTCCSLKSAIASALIGAKKGDTVTVTVKDTITKYTVLEITD